MRVIILTWLLLSVSGCVWRLPAIDAKYDRLEAECKARGEVCPYLAGNREREKANMLVYPLNQLGGPGGTGSTTVYVR